MKKIVFSLMIVACLLTLGVGNALAADKDYYTLESWISSRNGWSIISLVDPNEPFTNAGELQATVTVQGDYAADAVHNKLTGWTVGWYVEGSTPIIQEGENNKADLGQTVTASIAIHPGDQPFGIYLTDGTNYYYSQTKFNSGTQYAKTYQVAPADQQRVVVGFDTDKADVTYQYVDVVVDVQKVNSTAIPEFPTIALPIAAMLGLMFVFGRRKEE